MPDSRPYRKLMAKLEEYRARQRTWVIEGGPADYPAYREEVGAERMIKAVQDICDEIEKEENQ